MRRDDVVGRSAADLFPPEEAGRFLEQNRTVIESGTPLELDEEVMTPGGRRELHTVKFPLRDASGRIEADGRDLLRRHRRAGGPRNRSRRAVAACVPSSRTPWTPSGSSTTRAGSSTPTPPSAPCWATPARSSCGCASRTWRPRMRKDWSGSCGTPSSPRASSTASSPRSAGTARRGWSTIARSPTSCRASTCRSTATSPSGSGRSGSCAQRRAGPFAAGLHGRGDLRD